MLGFLSDLADEQPVLWVVDDAQWLDHASMQVLGFVARRLEAESTAILFGARDDALGGLAAITELPLAPLSSAQSRALLSSAISGPLDSKVADRIIAEAQGNPLAVLELPRRATSGDVAGGFAVPGGSSISDRVDASFRQRIEVLPAASRRLLLLAAAEPLGDPDLLWAAADVAGLNVSMMSPAEADGLLSIRTHVVFRHPTVRSVVYNMAEPEDRRLVHAALADATNPATDPDRRAWHRALASAQPDAGIAAELERSAERAHARGGLAAEAAFMQRAAELSPAGADRAPRALAAVEAKLRIGAPEDAREVLGLARHDALDPVMDARVAVAHAHIQSASGAADAPALLLGAAERLANGTPELSREVYLQAIEASSRAGIRSRPDISEVCLRTASSAPPAPRPPRPVDLLLDGYARRFTEGDAAAAPILATSLAGFREDPFFGQNPAVGVAAMHTAAALRDEATWRILASGLSADARAAGALQVLSPALEMLASVEMFCGRLDLSAQLISECDTITAAASGNPLHLAKVMLSALRGLEPETRALAETMPQDTSLGAEGWVILAANMSLAILCNSMGEYGAALRAARNAFEVDQTFFGLWAAPEVIEAAIRSGEPDAANQALGRLSAGSGATDWALGIQARSRALVTDDGWGTESLYVEAVERLGEASVAFDLARAHLLYGEWLRRKRRRTDARSQLRMAYELFSSMGSEAFAERTARELGAMGSPQAPRAKGTTPQLTPHQMQIALLASEGRTNQEIAARLFISPRTVEYHLRNVFVKLKVASRNQLKSVLDRGATPVRDAASIRE